jgi:hypothetical protein
MNTLAEILPSVDAPFWSDDFDMDLPKIIPDAKQLLGQHRALQLLTTGSVRDGMLMHPTVWNHHLGTIAMFSTRRGWWAKPGSYYTTDPKVVCSLWEAVRDAWSHGYVMLIDGVPVLNTQRMYNRRFYPLMSSLRGWSELPPRAVERHKMFVRAAIRCCGKKVARILVHNKASERVPL